MRPRLIRSSSLSRARSAWAPPVSQVLQPRRLVAEPVGRGLLHRQQAGHPAIHHERHGQHGPAVPGGRPHAAIDGTLTGAGPAARPAWPAPPSWPAWPAPGWSGWPGQPGPSAACVRPRVLARLPGLACLPRLIRRPKSGRLAWPFWCTPPAQPGAPAPPSAGAGLVSDGNRPTATRSRKSVLVGDHGVGGVRSHRRACRLHGAGQQLVVAGLPKGGTGHLVGAVHPRRALRPPTLTGAAVWLSTAASCGSRPSGPAPGSWRIPGPDGATTACSPPGSSPTGSAAASGTTPPWRPGDRLRPRPRRARPEQQPAPAGVLGGNVPSRGALARAWPGGRR